MAVQVFEGSVKDSTLTTPPVRAPLHTCTQDPDSFREKRKGVSWDEWLG